MNLIVGLGNPGNKYKNTRHNIGFLIIDKLAEFFKINSFRSEDDYLLADTEYKSHTVALLKPQTFMNLSGTAVKEFYERYEVEAEDMLIVYDDLNLDFGTLRMRPSGSDGGQKGIQSVIYHMETEFIPRLRIGIRNDEELEKFKYDDKYDLAEFVLSGFTPGELEQIGKITDASVNAVLSLIENGLKDTMNNFNKNILE
jgi:PTH1 family peptidyl-tRNA hydrolase